jgi:hypothetical protein
VLKHFGTHHWRDQSIFGVDLAVMVSFNAPSHLANPPEWVRWGIINFPRRLIGLFEIDTADFGVHDEIEDIEALPNGAYRYQECTFAIHQIPLNWLVAFKSVRWPSIALEIASNPRTVSRLLPADRAFDAESLLKRAADLQKEPPLFKFKPHQLKPKFLVDDEPERRPSSSSSPPPPPPPPPPQQHRRY